MTAMDAKVIDKMLSDSNAMKTAVEFIQKYQASLQVTASDLPAFPETL